MDATIEGGFADQVLGAQEVFRATLEALARPGTPQRFSSEAAPPAPMTAGLGAIALGLVNPLLALLPLVETGPGEDTNCRAILEPVKGAVRQSGKSEKDAPKGGEKDERQDSAPIVDVRPGDGTMGAERRPSAPIVEVPPAHIFRPRDGGQMPACRHARTLYDSGRLSKSDHIRRFNGLALDQKRSTSRYPSAPRTDFQGARRVGPGNRLPAMHRQGGQHAIYRQYAQTALRAAYTDG